MNLKPLPTILPDAPSMRLMVCCPTVKDFLEFTGVYCPNPKRKRTVADAWAYLQIWFCKHPQNTKFN
jgi:hypothetical protein